MQALTKTKNIEKLKSRSIWILKHYLQTLKLFIIIFYFNGNDIYFYDDCFLYHVRLTNVIEL